MAPSYISTIVNQLTEAIVEETAAEQEVAPPADPALVHEVGWVLHGTISHLLIRRHLYQASQEIELDRPDRAACPLVPRRVPGLRRAGRADDRHGGHGFRKRRFGFSAP